MLTLLFHFARISTTPHAVAGAVTKPLFFTCRFSARAVYTWHDQSDALDEDHAPCEEVVRGGRARFVIVRRCRHRSLSRSVCRSVGVMLTEHEAFGRATRRDCAPSPARYAGHEIFSRAAVNRWRLAAHRFSAPQP